jgi:deoxyribose-phosphate aldolase
VQVKAAGRFKEADEVVAAMDAGAARVASGLTQDLVRAVSEAMADVAVRNAGAGTVSLRS